MSTHPEDLLNHTNLSRLRLGSTPSHEVISTPQYQPRRPRILGQFLKGPISLDWLSAAARLPGKAPLAVALAIQFESGRQGRTESIKVTNPLVAKFGVSRKSKYTALDALEKAGLIRVSRQPRKSPIVTIMNLENQQ